MYNNKDNDFVDFIIHNIFNVELIEITPELGNVKLPLVKLEWLVNNIDNSSEAIEKLKKNGKIKIQWEDDIAYIIKLKGAK